MTSCNCGGKTIKVKPKKVAAKKVATKKVAPKDPKAGAGAAKKSARSRNLSKKATAKAKANNPYKKGCKCK